MHILIENLLDVTKAIGLLIKVNLPILLVLTTCICNGQKLMLGKQTLGKQIDYSTFSGKLAKQIQDVTECVILRTDVQDSLLWHRAKLLTWPQYQAMLDSVSYQSQGLMLKKMFTDKIVPISVNYPFFFKPIQDGMDRPKTELAYRVPASRFTRKKLDTNEQLEEIEGLDTTIDWKNTGDNSYDGEKLKLLVHDESGKWEKT